MRTVEEQEARNALKEKKKEYKKKIVEKYGYMYYLRDKTWINVKNQKEGESLEKWEARLEFYGFSKDGVDLRSGKQHFPTPLVLVYEDAYAPEEAPAEEAVAEEAVAEEAVAEEAVAEEAVAEEAVAEASVEDATVEEATEEAPEVEAEKQA